MGWHLLCRVDREQVYTPAADSEHDASTVAPGFDLVATTDVIRVLVYMYDEYYCLATRLSIY